MYNLFELILFKSFSQQKKTPKEKRKTHIKKKEKKLSAGKRLISGPDKNVRKITSFKFRAPIQNWASDMNRYFRWIRDSKQIHGKKSTSSVIWKYK